jgi:RNA polymerase sigma factor (sigma-70 family)
MEKDFNIKVTVRNGRLLKAIREDYESVAAFSRALGRNAQTVNKLVTMTEKPFKTKGWTDLALDVAAFLRKEPEDLWPEYMKEVQLPRSTAELSADLNEVQALQSSTSPEKQIAQLDTVKLLAQTLTPRELKVIQHRFVEGLSLEEAGKEMGVSGARLRQIEIKALRKMKKRAVKEGFLNTHDVWRTVERVDGSTFTYHQKSYHTLRDHARALFADEE